MAPLRESRIISNVHLLSEQKLGIVFDCYGLKDAVPNTRNQAFNPTFRTSGV